MKYLYFLLTFLLMESSSVGQTVTTEGIQEGDTIVVEGQYAATMATVVSLSPGRARIEMTPVYKVGLNQPPPNSRNPKQFSDVSGHGTLYWSRAGRFSADAGQLICWKGVNVNINACGPIVGTSTAAIMAVEVRGQMLVVYPVVEDQATNAHLAFAAHPQNTQAQLRCNRNGTENMASFFYVDERGTISVATLSQIAAYQAAYNARC